MNESKVLGRIYELEEMLRETKKFIEELVEEKKLQCGCYSETGYTCGVHYILEEIDNVLEDNNE